MTTFNDVRQQLIDALLVDARVEMVDALVKEDIRTVGKTWEAVASMNNGALTPLLIVYLERLFVHRKELLNHRVRRIASRKLRKQLEKRYPDMEVVMEEVAALIKKYSPKDHEEIFTTVKLMDLAEEVYEVISEGV